MTATALVGATVILPDRIPQVQGARIAGRANDAAGNRAGSSAHGGIARKSADGRATRGANHRATGQAVTRIGTATREQQGRGKTRDQKCVTHGYAPLLWSRNAPSR